MDQRLVDIVELESGESCSIYYHHATDTSSSDVNDVISWYVDGVLFEFSNTKFRLTDKKQSAAVCVPASMLRVMLNFTGLNSPSRYPWQLVFLFNQCVMNGLSCDLALKKYVELKKK